jgi:hypothetical protein
MYARLAVNIICMLPYCHVKWVPRHHSVAHRQAGDGGDGLHIWSLAANILNKQSRTADSGWSSSLGLGVGLITPYRKKKVTKRLTRL